MMMIRWPLVVVLTTAAAVFVAYPRFASPDLTETRLLVEYWDLYLFSVILFIMIQHLVRGKTVIYIFEDELNKARAAGVFIKPETEAGVMPNKEIHPLAFDEQKIPLLDKAWISVLLSASP